MRVVLLAALPLFLMACAQGFQGNDDDDDDDPPRIDAPVNPNIDAPSSSIDARIIDAPTSVIDAPGLPIDAPVSVPDGGIPGTCSDNTQCTTAGTCCFVALCVPGTDTGLPPPLNCVPD
jgi:hypothetical protein